jgi:PadR family transcriptional regulator, regulatory protein PadR
MAKGARRQGLAGLGEAAYGVPILREIQGRTRRRISRAAVCIALRRLEAKGFVGSRIGEKTAERGGRARRHVSLEKPGLLALQQTRDALVSIWQDFEPVLRRNGRT